MGRKRRRLGVAQVEVQMATENTEHGADVEAVANAGSPTMLDESDEADQDASDSDDQLGPSEHAESDDELEATTDEGENQATFDEEADEAASAGPVMPESAEQALYSATRQAIDLPSSPAFYRSVAAALARSGATGPSTLLPLLREYARERVAELEALAELIELYADGRDEALPIITSLSARAVLRRLQRAGTRLGVDARARLAQETERTAEKLSRERGRAALHELPELLTRAETQASGGAGRGYRRRFRMAGPVEIVIYAR